MGHDHLMLVNPWLACENVLISFVLLMQALTLNNDLVNDPLGLGSASQGLPLVQSAKQSAVLLPPAASNYGEGLTGDRSTALKEIWHDVRAIRDALVRQAQHWDMVIPMAEEVRVCLETSKTLFDPENN